MLDALQVEICTDTCKQVRVLMNLSEVTVATSDGGKTINFFRNDEIKKMSKRSSDTAPLIDLSAPYHWVLSRIKVLLSCN